MKRRIAVFAVLWAYIACWLWLPFVGPAEERVTLYFLPPGYFFVLGTLFGVIHELFALRLKRPLATLAILPLALEFGHWLYNGNALGFLLGGILAVAALLACSLALRLARSKWLAYLCAIFGTFMAMSWPLSFWVGEDHLNPRNASPDGTFAVWYGSTDTYIHSLHIEPRHGFGGMFGQVTYSGDTVNSEVDTRPTDSLWQDSRTLRIYAKGASGFQSSTLLPIQIVLSKLDERGSTRRVFGH
jgi:hypothetical protein